MLDLWYTLSVTLFTNEKRKVSHWMNESENGNWNGKSSAFIDLSDSFKRITIFAYWFLSIGLNLNLFMEKRLFSKCLTLNWIPFLISVQEIQLLQIEKKVFY